MKVCSVGGRKGSKEGSIISFPPADESCRRAEAISDYGGRTLLRLSRICSAGFSTVSSHLDTSVASRPYTAGTLSPGPTRTHTRQTHTVRPAFPSFIHLQRTWGEKAPDDNILTNVTKNLSTMYLSSGFLQTASVLMRTNNTATCYMLIMQLNIGHSV